MAAYRRVYDSRHLHADCQEPGSAPEPCARQSSMGYLYQLENKKNIQTKCNAIMQSTAARLFFYSFDREKIVGVWTDSK